MSSVVPDPLLESGLTASHSFATFHIDDNVTMTTITADQNPHEYEKEHVHEVYEQIASHFSSTRYKVRVLLEVRCCIEITMVFISKG